MASSAQEALAELRASIKQRPAMYFGDLDRFGGFANLLCGLAIDVAQAGATEVVCRLLREGRVEFRCLPSDELAQQWRSAAMGPERTNGLREIFSWRIAEALSRKVAWLELDDRIGATFEPDLDTFPFLAPVHIHPVVGALNDLATAYPTCSLTAEDERTGVTLRVRHSLGCEDRLRLEAGERNPHRIYRFTGRSDEASYDAALAWGHGPGLQVVAMTNGRRNANGGSHVQGVWEGIADALNGRLKADRIKSRPIDLLDIPRNAILVVSVHLDAPGHGPATRDCLHDDRAREALRTAVARDFFVQMGEEVAVGSRPPWQLLGGIHFDSPWLHRLPKELCDECRPGDRDPFHHHPGDE